MLLLKLLDSLSIHSDGSVQNWCWSAALTSYQFHFIAYPAIVIIGYRLSTSTDSLALSSLSHSAFLPWYSLRYVAHVLNFTETESIDLMRGEICFVHKM